MIGWECSYDIKNKNPVRIVVGYSYETVTWRQSMWRWKEMKLEY
jgi:hypothetical protein